jgi:hypothetical protein
MKQQYFSNAKIWATADSFLAPFHDSEKIKCPEGQEYFASAAQIRVSKFKNLNRALPLLM